MMNNNEGLIFMKDFVLYNSSETPHAINKDEFEKYTKGDYPFKQRYGGKNHYYATCPECENPIQLRGLYNSERKYGAHTGKNIDGLNPFNYENYIYCPRSVQGRRVPKEVRKEITSQKDINVYNMVRDNFDLAVAFAKKHLGYYISDNEAKKRLDVYYGSEGWLYPHSTVNNIPFMLFYLQVATNPYGLHVKKGSELEKAILNTKDLKLEPVSGNLGRHYNKLLPNSQRFMSLTMMLWHHQFKEDENGSLKESINIEICKDVSRNPERHEWRTLLDITVKIPELEFVKFVNAKNTYRNKDLQDYAKQLMPPL